MLWNAKPQILRRDEGLILTDYAFPKSGIYLIKASLMIPPGAHDVDLSPKIIESAAVQIVVEEPVGDDLKVWNKVKDRREVAYFMQSGRINAHEATERERLANEIGRIVGDHPTGVLSEQLRSGVLISSERQRSAIRKPSRKRSSNPRTKRMRHLMRTYFATSARLIY